MRADTGLSIAYIAGRLISGKNIISLYDYCRAGHIDMASLQHIECLTRSNAFGSTNGSKYRYRLDKGNFINLTINGSTFIGYVCDGSSHFIGKVRGDSIYLYDQEESAHFNYRISGCAVECQNDRTVCTTGAPGRRRGVEI
ncbi:MAG: hypothetical protein ABR903_06395 [Thermodesulfovibrionales bacterium]